MFKVIIKEETPVSEIEPILEKIGAQSDPKFFNLYSDLKKVTKLKRNKNMSISDTVITVDDNSLVDYVPEGWVIEE